MTYDDLKKMIAMKADGRSLTAIDDVLKAAVDVIANRIATGDKVTIPGLGRFSRLQRAARKGTNPQTRQAMNIPAMTVPKFAPSKNLKDAVR